MRWLFAWLFPFWALLPTARRLGSISFAEVAGVGWQCTIRPPYSAQRGAINAWSAQGKTLGGSLRAAIAMAVARPYQEAGGAHFAPRLGGAEFDE